jgi:RHS repeat-associated protein
MQATLGTECFEPGSFELEGGAPVPVPAPLFASLESPVGSALPVGASKLGLTFQTSPDEGTDESAPLAEGSAPAAVALTVGLGGVTSGTVTSNPVGVSCGGQGLVCTGWFAEGTTVVLTATPDAGQTFAGWAGDCTGTGTCNVSMIGSQSVRAVFTGPLVRGFYHLDPLGSVRAITDATGTTITRHDYLAFGEDPAPMTSDPIRFTGKELDAETGLQYFGARYVRNAAGRFTSPDPLMDSEDGILDPQRWNRYAYVSNKPLQFVDPDGRAQVQAVAVLAPAAATGPVGAVLIGGAAVVMTGVMIYENREAIGRSISDFFGSITDALGLNSKAEGGDKTGAYAGTPSVKYPGSDPTKAPEGYEWRGRPGSKPGDKEGGYYNPQTKESLRPDLDHATPIGPHWDYIDANGKGWRVFPDGRKEPK